MRLVSPLALGLMLALAGTTAMTAPAFAAKEKKAEAPKLKLGPEFTKAIIVAEQAIEKKDIEAAKASIAAAEPLAKVPDEIYQLNATRLNLSIVSGDAALQGQALTAMLDTGLVPAAQQGQFNAIVARQDLAANRTDSAIARSQKALAAGYNPVEANTTLAQAWFAKAGTGNPATEPARTSTINGLAALKAAAEATKASGTPAPAQWYAIGAQKSLAIQAPDAREWVRLAYDADPSGLNLRTELRLYQRDHVGLTPRENLDLMRLMGVSGGLAIGQDYAEYAEMASRTGVHGEVKSVIENGRTAGKLTPTQSADYYNASVAKIAGDKASLPAAEADAARAATGKIAAATAEAYLGYGNYAKAVSLNRLALSKGGVDAGEVNTRIGIALALSGDIAGAKAAFEQVTTGVRKDIAQYWLLWISKKQAA